MNNTALSNEDESFWDDDARILCDVERVASVRLSAVANSIDQDGYYPADIMGELGQAGAFLPHLKAYGERFDAAINNMSAISRHCGSTGFITWCQDVCGLYMELSGNPALVNRMTDHATGITFGGTALSNPMKAFTNIEAMALKASKVEGGYVVSGTLPWVSHIADGQCCGAIAAIDNADGSRSHEVMFMLDINEEVKLTKCPEFSGMEGTSTWALNVKGNAIDDGSVMLEVGGEDFFTANKILHH